MKLHAWKILNINENVSPIPDGSDTKLFSEKVNSLRAEKLPGSSKPESLFTGEGSQIADDAGK